MKTSLFKSPAMWLILAIVVICTLFFVFFSSSNSKTAAETPAVTMQDGYQVVTIQAKKDGFYPSDIEIKAGVPVKLNFVKNTSFTCITSVDSDELGFDLYLKKGENVTTLDHLKPGSYPFDCGMYMYHGTITVVA
ncbi:MULTISPECIES: cupredoxin domain-containing protein [unclassified Paenibacillus]|uniref:cupredoxin domain-containing protein n=1 Tax=unclassified Paenibacillus TaxID=185978 RepID=UPI0010E552CC|nr:MULTISPECIES: cupredoxin domain-containing protein [unclassified Paenibacillus]NIK71841.1 plastocyanin domain-containing protein [Paenibacillus sp. BK720]TCM96493.1 cupredoxin-like protein [Paenibacillus sp. BK033]